MSGFQLLMKPCDDVYVYDGSLAGFYMCMHTAVYHKEMPSAIQAEGEGQCSLLPPKRIRTDLDKAGRVRAAVGNKISRRALELCENVFLSCAEKKEMMILRFLVLGFQVGGLAAYDLTHPLVAGLLSAEKHLLSEAHLLLGFVRFSDHQGMLMAGIAPKNFVLPLIAPHFADRYGEETLLIHDRTHDVALVCSQGKAQLVDAPAGLIPVCDETELYYQQLWKRFYQTISIKERENHKCRRTHMPMRYWENTPELG